jgi:hypothetical protein
VIILICPPHQDAQQIVRAFVQHRPSINWPDDFRKPLEQPEEEHPAHEDRSPMYLGLGANTPITNTSAPTLIFHSSLSFSGASDNLYATVPTTWLPVGPYLAANTRDLDLGERFSSASVTSIAPDTKKHLANPSTRKVFQARPGGRGRS